MISGTGWKQFNAWLGETFELGRGGQSNLRSMEGLRGFAVFIVFLVHYFVLLFPWLSTQSTTFQIASLLHNIGHTGVDLFFMLSGFLIYGSLIRKQRPFTQYISRRIERIYPTFLAVFLVYVLLSFVFPERSKIPAGSLAGGVYLLENLLLLPGMFNIQPLISVAWSLSYEFFFYLSVPVVISVFRLRIWHPRQRVVLFLLLSAALLLAGILFPAIGERVRLVMFLSGILLYEGIANQLLPTAPKGLGLLALVFSLTIIQFFPSGISSLNARTSVLFVSFFLLGWSCFTSTNSPSAKLFSWTPLRWLGNMSYSYYLIHGLTLQFVFLLLGRVYPPAAEGVWIYWIGLPFCFILTLISSAVLFILVERPYSLFPPRLRAASKKLQAV